MVGRGGGDTFCLTAARGIGYTTSMVDPELGRRLDAAITVQRSSYAALADALGVTRSAVGHWINGRRSLDVATCERIAPVLGIRAAWLAFGEGPMVATEREHAA